MRSYPVCVIHPVAGRPQIWSAASPRYRNDGVPHAGIWDTLTRSLKWSRSHDPVLPLGGHGKAHGAKSPEKAIEVQSEYIKMAYEGFFAQATKIGEELTISLRKNAAKFDSCARCGRVCSRSG